MQRDPAAPPVLDGYTAVRPLGAGGFADVYLYEQELPRREVAVKVLSGQVTDAVRAAFVREANLMAALSTHPYIVTIHHAGVAPDGRPYLVMEYCSRPSLAERYKRRPLSVADALRTGIRIAGAVATLHAAGILHRDIKPANVLTNDYGWPALTDFGIATVFDRDGAAGATAASRPAGGAATADADPGTTGTGSAGLSVPWSPPEMFADQPEPDVRSDVFSLAATIYTVLAGRTPFEVPGGPNGQLDLISRIERGQVTPMTRTDVPPSLLAALARGMAPRREDRWPGAVEFARALQRVELELGYAPTGIEVPTDAGALGSVRQGPGAGDGGADDATLARAATPVIAAQPTARSGAAREPAPSSSAASRAVSPPAAASRDLAGAPPRDRRRLVIGLVVAGLALLAIAAVVAAILATGLPRSAPQDRGSGPAGDAAPAVIVLPPSPTDGAATVSPDGTSVTFTWTDPEPRAGDVFFWARSETPDERASTSEPQAVVTGIVPGSRVCVDVQLSRSGRDSASARICTAP